MRRLVKEEVMALWGRTFFDECYAEALAMAGPCDVSIDLVFVIAIGKLIKREKETSDGEGKADQRVELPRQSDG